MFLIKSSSIPGERYFRPAGRDALTVFFGALRVVRDVFGAGRGLVVTAISVLNETSIYLLSPLQACQSIHFRFPPQPGKAIRLPRRPMESCRLIFLIIKIVEERV